MKATNKQTQEKIIFLFGPTAVGKTALLSTLFSQGFEVVNADSVQVYRLLNIASAKATEEEQRAIRHHLIDVRDPWEDFSVGDFIDLADKACDQIHQRGNIPVLCGGTAFYFKHFLFGLSKSPKSDPIIRQKVQDQLNQNGLSWCYERLKEVDPISATRIHPNDAYRITRAIEVFESGQGKLSDFPIPTEPRNNLKPLIIGLTRPKEEIDKRIRQRIDIMFEEGIVDEIKSLKAMGATLDWPGIRGIGYQEFFKGEEDLEKIKESIAMNSIHYAKRQKTFFNSFANCNWVNPTDTEAVNSLLQQYLQS